jgi:hypothetical protein
VKGVEPTNHGAERALRPTVLWRKGSLGCDSEAGSRFAERLLTVAATCRQQGRGLLDFLVAAGERAVGNRPTFAAADRPGGLNGYLFLCLVGALLCIYLWRKPDAESALVSGSSVVIS